MTELYERKQKVLGKLQEASGLLEWIGQDNMDSAAMDYHHQVDILIKRIEDEVRAD